jgi:hypothetical protein
MSAESSWGLSTCNPIPAARMRVVCRLDEVEKRLDKLSPREYETLCATCERMLEKGGERFQVKPLGLSAMEHLYDELPNFHPVLDEVRRPLALCAGQRRRRMDPLGKGLAQIPLDMPARLPASWGGEAGGRRGSTCRSRLTSGTLGQSAQDALRRDAPQKVTQRFAGLVMEGGTGALHQGPFPDAVEAKAAEVRARLTPGGQRPLLAPEEAGQRPHGAP